jgi:hypothetical protein
MASQRKDIRHPATVIVASRDAARRMDDARRTASVPNAALKAVFARGNSLLANSK